MPFARAPLTELRTQVAQDIATALPGADPLLRHSNLGILGTILAGLTHLHYGYLDWIAQQSVPFTATDEYLEGWAALKGVTRLPATQASGTATFTGTNGTLLPVGTEITRRDGVKYLTTANGTVSGGSVTVPALAAADPTGQAGAAGNCDAGTTLSIVAAVAGMNAGGVAATPFVGGADVEGDDSLRERMLLAFQTRARGGSVADFIAWARQVPGVTRAWVVPHSFGGGTLSVFFMMDVVHAGSGGFPVGSNGVATSETRHPMSTATGDQLAMANYLYALQPVPSLVFALAPTPHVVNFNISGLSSSTTDTRNAIAEAIRQVFYGSGEVTAGTTTVDMTDLNVAIAAVPGSDGFAIVTPTSITNAAGELPVLGTITWS